MNVLEVVRRAQACCARVPDRRLSDRTRQNYKKTFLRMWEEGSLDPLTGCKARDTYNNRRAALHSGGKLYLQERIDRCMAAGDAGDAAAAIRHARELHRAVEQIEKAFDLEPPLPAGASPPPPKGGQSSSIGSGLLLLIGRGRLGIPLFPSLFLLLQLTA